MTAKISPAAQELLEGQKDMLEVLGTLVENAEEISGMMDWWTSVLADWAKGDHQDAKGFAEALKNRLPELEEGN